MRNKQVKNREAYFAVFYVPNLLSIKKGDMERSPSNDGV